MAGLVGRFKSQTDRLETAMSAVPHDAHKGARFVRDEVFPAMQALRDLGDGLEDAVAAGLWPMPTYRELLTIR